MEEKPDKKKESIDEILSDLNGLLNKMPSILDGIKMPEMQPLETPKPAPQARPAVPPETEPAAPADAGEETVVLQPFAGLEEGAPVPAVAEQAAEPALEAALEPAAEPVFEPLTEAPAEPAQEPLPSFDAEKTVVLEAFSGLPEGSAAPAAPETEQLAPQSLGDFMFGQDAGANQEPAPAVESSAIVEFDAPAVKAEAQAPAALPPYENTRDFGIPDIDALMQMSDSAQAPAEEEAPQVPEAGVIPESVQAEEQAPEPLIQGLEAAPLPEPVTVEGIVENGPKDDNLELQPAGGEPLSEGQPAAQADSPFDAFAIDPASAEAAPGAGGVEDIQPEPALEMLQPSDGAETLRLEPQAEMPGEPVVAESPAEPAAEPLQGGETLNFETAAESAAQEPQFGEIPAAAEPAAGGIELSPGLELGAGQPQAEAADQTIPGGGLELSVGQPQAEAADQTIPGGGLELSVGQPQAEAADQTIPGGGLELSVGQPGSGGGEGGLPGGGGMVLGGGDATLVVPPAGGAGDEEKTVIFQAGQPSTTSRAQAGDLEGLASKQAPEGIPAERLRTLMFLYAPEDKALCATALAELDAICLKSSTKPMFIKRAAVKECDPEANANFVMQSMSDVGAQGLVCLGALPQEKVYEIENVFNTSGGFFRYYDSSTFNHSAALDLVTDLILR